MPSRRLLKGILVMCLCFGGAVHAAPPQPAMVERAQAVAAALQEAKAISERTREDAMAQALESTARATAARPEPPSHEPLADRMNLPSFPPLGSQPVTTPLEKTRREVLTAQKRAGFQKFYKEGIGFEPVRGLGFSGRTEIFEQPNPVDDYILESKILNFSELSQFRRSLTPLFIRSAAGRVTMDYEPFPRVTYEYDARETLHEFETRFNFKDIDLQTHAVNALYSFPEVPWFGVLTLNPWYKRVLQSSDNDLGSGEHRDQMILNVTLQPTDDIEYFFQLDMYDADKTRTVGASKLKLLRGEARLRFPRLRLFVIPGYEYSDTDFDPSDDEFTKKTAFVDWGFDITDRWRVSSKQEVIKSEVSRAGNEPSNPDAEVLNWTNTLSYELFKEFDVSLGFDFSRGFGYSNFNNVSIRAEVEFFKPGFIRSKFGYQWASYYNIHGDLSLIFWKFFLFQ